MVILDRDKDVTVVAIVAFCSVASATGFASAYASMLDRIDASIPHRVEARVVYQRDHTPITRSATPARVPPTSGPSTGIDA